MKKTLVGIGLFIVAGAVAVGAASYAYSKDAFGEKHMAAAESDLVRMIEVVPYSGDREVAVFYETTKGIGVAHFERYPVLNKWYVSERYFTLFEKGVSQNYVTFKVQNHQQDFAMVYGAFTPAEDYNLPIRLRNSEEAYDEKPLLVENQRKDVIWYQYLMKPSKYPERFEVYNEVTGTVITR